MIFSQYIPIRSSASIQRVRRVHSRLAYSFYSRELLKYGRTEYHSRPKTARMLGSRVGQGTGPWSRCPFLFLEVRLMRRCYLIRAGAMVLVCFSLLTQANRAVAQM